MRRIRLKGALFLLSSLGLGVGAAPAQAADPMRAFAGSGYTYCDAKLIAAFWRTNVGQAKSAIGQKIINGIGSNIGRVLANSRAARNSCGWEDTGYSYDDAVKLARLWGLKDPYQAKLKVARYVTNGEDGIVKGALAS